MIIFSFCIPTYNRAAHLCNWLSSFAQCCLSNLLELQICISDNCSTDTTKQLVDEAGKVLTIKYTANESNIGLACNFLEVVDMADGELVWMVGDDDLLMPESCEKIVELIKKNYLVKNLVIKIANKWPNRYETYLSNFFLLDDITYYLKICKNLA